MSSLSIRFGVLSLALVAFLVPSGPGLDAANPSSISLAASVGEWSAPEFLPHSAIHSTLLPTGKILFWDNKNVWDANWTFSPASVWDPSTGVIEDVRLTDAPGQERKVFCSGHVLLSDGRVLVVGGEQGFARGLESTFLFDSSSQTWSRGPDMSVGRYYPSALTLADGSVLTMAGNDVSGAHNGPVEVFRPGETESWTVAESAHRVIENYPKLHLLPDGDVVRAGPERQTLFYDPGRGTWRDGPVAGHFREDGSSVLLPGLDRVLTLGGNSFPLATNTAEILELGDEPRWRPTAAMTFERRNQNAVLLPDGTVFVVGGATSERVPVLFPERFDPATETWNTMAPQASARTYHSTAVLLPDGRVFSAGGDTELGFVPLSPVRTYEIYSPPYLFRGDRPTVQNAPDAVAFSEKFRVATPDAPEVAKVVLVRHASVTHSFDFDQRLMELPFKLFGGSQLKVESPEGPTIAPPGWYMLFLLDGDGVPSVAKSLRVGL